MERVPAQISAKLKGRGIMVATDGKGGSMRDERAIEAELTRRGFAVLAVSAATAFFLKPDLVVTAPPLGGYVVSLSTIGYGHLWRKELGEEPVGPMSAAELMRESLVIGDVLRFEQEPSLPKDVPFLVIVKDGIALADIPWRATPEEESAVSLIVERINEGRDVWAEVASASHRTMDAYNEYARIHELELDVYFR